MSKEASNPWINNCRVAILLALLVAIMGPWTFDRINVPAEYPCSAPNIRLEGDFCGMPMSGTWIFSWMIGEFIIMGVELVTGATGFADSGGEFLRAFLFIMVLLLLLLPIFSTLLLIMRGDRRHLVLYPVPVGLLDPGAQGPRAGQVRPSTGRWQVFNAAAWGLAASMGLLIGITSYHKLFWRLWGIWLYIGLAVIALIVEVLTLKVGTRSGQGSGKLQ